MKTLFLHPPSFDGFDGGAGARYQAKREIRSFWYPTWLAQPAALVPDSKLLDAPADGLGMDVVGPLARQYDLVIMHTSSPSFPTDAKVAERLKQAGVSAEAVQLQAGELELHGYTRQDLMNLPNARDYLGPAAQGQGSSANVLNLQKRVAGVLPVPITVPRTGTSFAFVRPLVLDEETKVTFSYKSR